MAKHSATTVKVASKGKWEPGMQESDMMDQLPDGESRQDELTQDIMLVSLGCFCGPKLSFKNIGRGAETLPFDWMRTRHEGLMHFLSNSWDETSNYNDFFEFTSKKVVPGCSMTTYRSYYHSFWHDDPTDPGMLDRYMRRIKRFNAIDAESKPVLFVRTIPTTEELRHVPALSARLIERHGKQACLLLIIDFQNTATGAALVQGYPNLMFYYLSGSNHVDQAGLPAPPYGKPVNLALDWIAGRSIDAMQFSSIEKIIECADPTEWGLNGLGGLFAFEQTLVPEAEDTIPSLPWPMPALPAKSSKELVAHFAAQAPSSKPSAEGTVLVPLGCCGLVKASMLSMGLPSLDLPFDWLQISDAGLLHFLRKGFEEPIRNGLGAGGQRPSEKRGFFDFASRKKVPGTSLTMCRSHVHSFWHDDVADPAVRLQLDKQIDLFNSLGLGGETLLFVRAVATEAELSRADEILAALTKKFSQNAALLLICDFQSTAQGPHFVQGCEDLMVYFLEAEAHATPVPYRKPIETALAWLSGDQLEAAYVPDLKGLQGLADPTSWGLAGLGGLHAFEGCLDSEEPERQPGPEDQWLMDAKFEADKDSLALVSLGYHEFLGRGLEQAKLNVEPSPFEGAFVRLEGVQHFLRNDFQDFFEMSEPRKVPGTEFSVSRSGYLSLWEHESKGGENSKHHGAEQNIKSLRQLAKSNRPKVFVRAAVSSEELGSLGELYADLARYCRGHVQLVVVLGGQTVTRSLTVEGHQFHILVQLVQEDISKMQGYAAPVKASLAWAVGQEVKVGMVADFEALKTFASESGATAPIYGPGNLPIFEDMVSTTDESGESPMSSAPGSKAEARP
eukprot:TRINITY_DN105885_c0_g1_i1.p1 TRINITY_DN105885_c0_g1~~TRINITY_DN105885_c0_g1_i1.p1  ORF type:complete len:844 (-),score=166.08 TRINITY_DN105885_c0_g1_i1:208-2739(-)